MRGTPAVHCLGKGSRSWLVTADTPDADARLRRQLSGYWNTLQLKPPTPLAEGMQNGDISLRQHILTYGGKRVCLLADGRWRGLRTVSPLRLDYLYIVSGYTGSLAELTALFTIGTVVLDASLPQSQQLRIMAECQALAIPCHQLAEEGILRFPL
ncbi:MAG: hypothetical protein LUC18_02450 [Porphyromonadaceae bacterium]|nr:hypothetical protein [Porphyromonadaceae bacterium]